jgi:hypothetical protein
MHAALQVLIGLLIVLVVYVVALSVMGVGSFAKRASSHLRERFKTSLIVDGHASLLSLADRSWSTSDSTARNYVPLTRSLNQRGGIEFTYAFWIKISSGQGLSRLANQVVLLRGDRTPYRWQKTEAAGAGVDGRPEQTLTYGPDTLIKCPCIRFGRSYDEWAVSYNTLDSPNAGFVVRARDEPNDPSLRRNALKLMLDEWTLVTFTFKDTTPTSDFEDGIEANMYLNDSLYYTHRAKGAFKVNDGDLFVAPSSGGAGSDPASALNQVRIGDLRYMNFAASPSAVAASYRQGPPKEAYGESSRDRASESDPLYLSEYNKLDIYNT